MHVYRTCSGFFFLLKTAGEILCVSIELVLFFLSVKTAGENPMRVYRTCSVFFIAGETLNSELGIRFGMTLKGTKKLT
jgi:hypothetical protein